MKFKLSKQPLVGQFRVETWNAEKREIDICFGTGARRLTPNIFGEPYYEEVVMTTEAGDLTRLDGGAPLLDNHAIQDGRPWQGSVRTILGRTAKAWISNGEGWVRVRFGKRQEIAGLIEDILDGTIVDVSFGYDPLEAVRIDSADDPIPTIRITRWLGKEVSMTTVPAEYGAQVRSDASQEFHEIEVRCSEPAAAQISQAATRGDVQEESPMKKCPKCGAEMPADADKCPSCGEAANAAPTDAGTRTATPTTVSLATVRAAEPVDVNALVAAERTRISGITEAARVASVGDDVVKKAIDDGLSVDQAKALFYDTWVARDNVRTATAHADVRVTRDATDTRRQAMEDAMILRYNPQAQLRVSDAENRNAIEVARQYRGLSLVEMARVCVEATGVRTAGMTKAEIAGLALGMTRAGEMTTSDFPKITANVANKAMLQAYTQAPQTWRPLVREVSAADFKTLYRLALSEAPRLEEVKESEEIKRGKFTESQETYAVKTYAKIAALSRKTIINDDMGAFTEIPASYGRAAADLESDTVWALITANGNMADGIALFHASHNNLGTGGAISLTTLGEARKLLRKQKALQNKQILNLLPKYLVVPAAIETTAQQYLNQSQLLADQAANVNPFAGLMQLIVEPRLDDNSATAWYMAADPGQRAAIEVAYLEGQRGVYIETREGFDIDGIEFKARLDFGAGVTDFRPLVKNAGA